MYRAYRDRVAFLFVYIREAHPTDEWQLPDNEKEDVLFAQPKSSKERVQVARSCNTRLGLSLPTVVDDMQNSVDAAYAAWPERMFVIQADGIIAYAGKPGPWGFKPDEVGSWLEQHVGRPAIVLPGPE